MKSASIFCAFLFGFSSAVSAMPLRPQTNLGTEGNAYAADRFKKYQSEGFVCGEPKADKVRVLLSGFAPFDGGTENASGLIVGAFGNVSAPKKDVDVYGNTREVLIDGVNYQICFLVVSTVWDISAAILISEMERFSPQFALMTGLGLRRLTFETGNSNRASFSGGYDINGNPVTNNLPAENYVLPPTDKTVPFISLLTWDTKAARDAVDQDVKKLGYETFIPEPGYEANNYICNNVAFVATHAVQNYKTELARGLITLYPHFASAPKLGFLHYPASISTAPDSLQNWVDILSKIVKSNTQQGVAF